MTFNERHTLGEPCESALVEFIGAASGWVCEPFGAGRFNAPFLSVLRHLKGNCHADALRLDADAVAIHAATASVIYVDVKTRSPHYKNFAVALECLERAAVANSSGLPSFLFVFALSNSDPKYWRVCPIGDLPRYIVGVYNRSENAGSGKAYITVSACDMPRLSAFLSNPVDLFPPCSETLALTLDRLVSHG
jgi:hypothetical protein